MMMVTLPKRMVDDMIASRLGPSLGRMRRAFKDQALSKQDARPRPPRLGVLDDEEAIRLRRHRRSSASVTYRPLAASSSLDRA